MSLSTTLSALTAVGCTAFIYLESKGAYFGKLTNSFEPCRQTLTNSAPCYAATSWDAVLTAALIGFSALAILTFQLGAKKKA